MTNTIEKAQKTFCKFLNSENSDSKRCGLNSYKELGITRQTLYRYVSPEGELRKDGQKLLKTI